MEVREHLRGSGGTSDKEDTLRPWKPGSVLVRQGPILACLAAQVDVRTTLAFRIPWGFPSAAPPDPTLWSSDTRGIRTFGLWHNGVWHSTPYPNLTNRR
jgi:hypothetical protein